MCALRICWGLRRQQNPVVDKRLNVKGVRPNRRTDHANVLVEDEEINDYTCDSIGFYAVTQLVAIIFLRSFLVLF